MNDLPGNQESGLGQTGVYEVLLQSCWQETLGLTTARLVHDFNNLLTGILSLSDAYLTQVAPDNPLREGLALMNQNARQAVEVVQTLSRLYRETPGPPSYQNLNALLAQYAALLQKVLPRHSTTRFEAAAESLPVYIDPVEFRKAVLTVSLLFAGALPHSGQLLLKAFPPASVEISAEVLDAARESLETFFAKPSSPGASRGELVYDLAMTLLRKNGGTLSAQMEHGRAVAILRLPQADFTELERDLARPPSGAK